MIMLRLARARARLAVPCLERVEVMGCIGPRAASFDQLIGGMTPLMHCGPDKPGPRSAAQRCAAAG